ncbi:hypothetical protein [Paracoccus albus]|uniref:hypothetical protein n=1 Tax=Paracoccus albus TaxID=3017784 RepID=UPI0022F04EF2|nr:hypothetical protein [Paracoccus albus]WBU61796.1 hypothetical protein PAF20_07880 [Paracoccus albus]
MSEFENLGLKAGVWTGRIRRGDAPKPISLFHKGDVVGQARIAGEGEGVWQVAVNLPVDRLNDGVTTFLLIESASDESPADPMGRQVASLVVSAGQALQQDVLAEMELIRSELDLLKKEFRRFGAEGRQG